MRRFAAVVLLIAVGGAGPPGARDPDWPCQQIKVAELSLAAVWSGPDVDVANSGWKQDEDIADLVQRIAPRRVPIETAQAAIHRFAERAGPEKRTRLLAALAGVFTVQDAERDSVLAGLDRFGHRQKELAEEIRGDMAKLRTLQDASGSDPNAVSQLTEQVKWEAEVFENRRQAVRYACDVPAKIEQRLFALARAIQGEVE